MQGVKIINIGGTEIGLYRLEEIYKEVRGLGIDGDVLKEELLKRVKIENYIPEGREGEYKSAIFEIYKTFFEKNNSG